MVPVTPRLPFTIKIGKTFIILWKKSLDMESSRVRRQIMLVFVGIKVKFIPLCLNLCDTFRFSRFKHCKFDREFEHEIFNSFKIKFIYLKTT